MYKLSSVKGFEPNRFRDQKAVSATGRLRPRPTPPISAGLSQCYTFKTMLEGRGRYPFTYADAEEKSGIASNLLRSLYEVSVYFIRIAPQSTHCCRNASTVLQMFGKYYITQFWCDRHSTRCFLWLCCFRYFRSIQYARRSGYIRFGIIEHL